MTRPTPAAPSAEWHARAACAGRTDINWYPARYESPLPALDVCRTCPVVAECLTAEQTEVQEVTFVFGVRGGLTEQERRAMRIAAAGHVCPTCGQPCVTAQGLSSHRALRHGWGPECGTPEGYDRHRSAGEETCGPCRQAHAAKNAAQRRAS